MADPFQKLTERQRQIVNHVLAGQSSKAIAVALGLTSNTVKGHRSNILKRLGLRTTAELFLLGYKHGIINGHIAAFAGFLKAVARHLDMHPDRSAAAVLAGADQLATIYMEETTDPKSAAKQFQKSRAAPLATAPPNVE